MFASILFFNGHKLDRDMVMALTLCKYANIFLDHMKKVQESILLIDRRGSLVHATEYIATQLGYTTEMLIGKSIEDIAPMFDFKQYFYFLNRGDFEYKTSEVMLEAFDVQKLPVQFYITYDNSCDEELLVVHIHEISNEKYHTENEKELSEQNELLRFLIDQVPSPLVVKDYNAKFVLTNRSVAELYGAPTPQSMHGKDDGDYIPDKNLVDFFRDNVRQIMDDGKTRTVFEDSIDVRTGQVRNFQSMKKPFLDKYGKKHILLVATDVTELRNIQSDLEEQKKLLRQIIDELPNPFIVKDYDGKFVLTNKALADLYNVEKPDMMIGKDDSDFISQTKQTKFFKHNVRSIMDKGETKVVYEDSFDAKTGEKHNYMSIKKPFVNYKGEQQILVITNDITEIRNAEKTLKQYEKIMSVTHDFLSYVDKEYRYQAVNDTYLTAFKLSRDEIIGKNPINLYGEKFFHTIVKPKYDLALQGHEVVFETWLTTPAFGERFVEISYRPYYEKSNLKVEGIVAKICDITERYEAQRKLQYMAVHDTLTGLPNRRLFSEHLALALKRAERNDNQVAVLFIDLDRFKVINDSLGHVVGDVVLQEISNRLLQHIRKSDTLARCGGDEFLLILDDINSPDNVAYICDKFFQELNKPLMVNGNELFITASIGISMYPIDAVRERELIQSADTAMYQAKSLGRNNFQFSNKKLRNQVEERFHLEKNLRIALKNNEFILYFQPQVDIESQKIIGAEALLRWHHPEYGLIVPDKFIPVAEESGMIISIGQWVLYEACRQMKLWQDQGIKLDVIAVNVSGNQLLQKNFISIVQECLSITGLPAHMLELEVTESYLMNDMIEVTEKLNILRSLGISVAIDDFGTGYSSLRYLQKLPISKLKIDRSFVSDVPHDKEDCEIVKTIIGLARNMKLDVIAEGVETPEQEAFLITKGCNLAQGYIYSKPIKEDAFSKLCSGQVDPVNTSV